MDLKYSVRRKKNAATTVAGDGGRNKNKQLIYHMHDL